MKFYKRVTMIFVLATFLTSIGLTASAASYTIAFGDKPDTQLDFRSPLPTYSQVNSKWNQPRGMGTSPHQGVDLSASTGTKLYAVYSGYVEHSSYGGTADIRFRVTASGTSTKGANDYFVYYSHNNTRKAEGFYAKGAEIGTSGSNGATAAHLHFGNRLIDDVKWVRNEINYRWQTSWDEGRRLDSYSWATWTSNKAGITAYFADETSTNIAAAEVRIYYRAAGTSAYTDGGTMTKSGDKYTYNFAGKYTAGTTVQWLVRIQRPGLSVYSYAWAPAKFIEPAANPNSSSYVYAYYSNTIT